MTDNRKKWDPPRLIVLGRGTPEENVLIGCKMEGMNAQSGTQKKCSRGGRCQQVCSAVSMTS
jgi:hypothetical protein